MNKKLKAKWIKALRSGDFKQGREELEMRGQRDTIKYCCLGVLCKIGKLPYDKGDTEIAQDVLGDIGLTEIQQQELISRNDDKKHSFKRIADYIEKNIEAA